MKQHEIVKPTQEQGSGFEDVTLITVFIHLTFRKYVWSV